MSKFFKIIFFLFLLYDISIFSSPILEIKNKTYNQVVGENLQYFIDKESNLNIDDIVSNKESISFQNNNLDIPNFGYTSSTVWFRINIIKNENLDKKIYLNIQNSNIDNIEIYELLNIKNSKPSIKKTILGDHLIVKDKEYFNREFLFLPQINQINQEEIYFKINSTSSVIFPLYIIDEITLNKDIAVKEVLHGIYYGVVIAIFLYNLFVFSSTKDITFFYFILYIFGFGMLQSIEHGHSYIYLWPENPEFQQKAFPFFMGITISFASLFSKSYLKTSIYSPILNNILLTFSYLGLVLIVSGFLIEDYKVNLLSIFLAVISLCVIFISAIIIYKKYFEPSRYFLIAWVLFLIGSSISLMRLLALVDLPLYSAYALELASIFQIITLSYALTAKVNIIKRESQEAIKRTVFFQEQANAELEQKVKDRTIEVNKYLSSIEKDLKMARNIQMNILPKNVEKISNFKIATYYRPLDEVGGDFYDVYQMSDTKIRILIADATGHGIQAAMVTMTIKSEYDSLKVFLSDPGELIDELQRRFVEIYKNMKIYFSAFIADIDLETQELSYASAGHPNQYLIQEGKVIELIRSGHIIGMLGSKQCTTNRHKFNKGDKLFLFTDGLYEEFNSQNEQFGDEKLKKLIEDNNELDMNNLIEKILNELINHLSGKLKQDDITIITLEDKTQ
jgi:serine phosphatase RsbU (regulator of sigma subunit)